MQTFFTLFLSLFLGWGCSQIALRRGRSPRNWFIAGVFFGVFALIVLFILPRRTVKETVNAPQPQKSLPTLAILSSSHAEKLWYFLDDEKAQFGPMSFDALSRAWHEGKIKQSTYVWNEAMENWQPFQEVIQSAQS